MDYLLPGDIEITYTMQGLGEWLTPFMKFFTYLGNPEAYILVIAVIYWSFDRKLGLRLAIFLPVVVSLNSILKQAFHAPRPFWVDPDIQAIKVANGFGLPSGHAQASTLWLYAASWLKRLYPDSCEKRWSIWIVAIVLVFMVGLSRVYLGVHFASQVLFGWLIGIIVLILFPYLERKVLDWFLGKRFIYQLAWISGITLFILVLGGVFVYLLKDWEIPPEWIRNAADDLACTGKSIQSSKGMGAVAGSAAVFLGVALGALLSHRRGGFDARGNARKRWLRGLFGGFSLAVLFSLLLCIAPDESRNLLYPIWRFSGFFILSFSVIFLLPLLFRRFDLF
jgi:membrane-associated phospholipid phosphatase